MDIAIPASFDGLPLHRAKVEPICRYAVGRAEVVGMAVTGSFAAGHPDAYSDVDLRVAVEDDALESALADRRVFADAGGTVVAMFTGEHVGAPELAIVLYDDLTHVDLHFQPAGRVGEMGRGLPAIVLWERDGRLTAQLPGADPEDPAAKLAWWEARMWTWCWYVQAKILRGEVYEALDGLGYLRATVLFPLLAMSRGRPAVPDPGRPFAGPSWSPGRGGRPRGGVRRAGPGTRLEAFTMSPRIAVLGAGAMGASVTKLLARHDDVEILVLDVDGERASAAAAAVGSTRAEARAFDAEATGELAGALRGAGSVAACLPYRLNLTAMRAALDSGVPYSDLGGLFHMTRRQLELDGEFRAAGLPAVIGIGACPGLSNVMARLASHRLDAVDAI